MRLSDALLQADLIRPNAVETILKVNWLWRLEADIATMMDVDIPKIEPDDDPELLMPDPYSNIYPLYLCAYIDYVQEETDLYQLDMSMANAAVEDAKNWWLTNNGTGDTGQMITGVFF